MSEAVAKISVAAVEAALPQQWFVRRGHVMEAFALKKDDMAALVVDGRRLSEAQKAAETEKARFVAEYLPGDKRARFVRPRCIRVAQILEGAR
jgi:hypothetical protein